jgi:uncharacterized protein (TIGR03435 family)
MYRLAAIATAMIVVSLVLSAQNPPPAFEAASIKETKDLPRGPNAFAPDRFSRSYISLVQLLIYVHQVADFQILGGPDWVRTTRFTVEAKAEGRPTADQMRLMVQRLLEERFALKVHKETRELPRYALVMAREDKRLGPTLKPSKIDCPAIVAARGPDYRPPIGPRPWESPRCGLMVGLGGGSMTIMLEGQPISEFVRTLQTNAGRVIVDRTGLTGTFDVVFQTEMTRTNLPPGLELPGATSTPPEGLSLFTALPEQLGLKLESERGPVDVIVIDSAQMPTPN